MSTVSLKMQINSRPGTNKLARYWRVANGIMTWRYLYGAGSTPGDSWMSETEKVQLSKIMFVIESNKFQFWILLRYFIRFMIFELYFTNFSNWKNLLNQLRTDENLEILTRITHHGGSWWPSPWKTHKKVRFNSNEIIASKFRLGY